MKQLTQKFESPTKGGFSDTRVRLYVFGFMIIGLILTPFFGMLASFALVLIFGIFVAVKISKFQEHNRESILRHRQAMDRMYNYSAKAEYYKKLLKPYKIHSNKTKRVIKQQKAKQISYVSKLKLAPISTN